MTYSDEWMYQHNVSSFNPFNQVTASNQEKESAKLAEKQNRF